MKDRDDKIRTIRTDLTLSLSKEFECIKCDTGIQSDAEAIRFCIHQVYKGPVGVLPQHLKEKIEELMTNPEILEKYTIFDTSDFIVKAIIRFIREIEKNNH